MIRVFIYETDKGNKIRASLWIEEEGFLGDIKGELREIICDLGFKERKLGLCFTNGTEFWVDEIRRE